MNLCRQENERGQISRDWARFFHRGAMPINSYTPKIFQQKALACRKYVHKLCRINKNEKNNIQVNLDFKQESFSLIVL